MKVKSLRALRKAVRLAGTQTELASRITKHLKRPVNQAHVWSWLNRDKRAPGWAVVAIEVATARQVTRHELRADIFPREA